MPFAAAVDAVPILKLCPACTCRVQSIPAEDRIFQNLAISLLLVRGELSLKRNSTPGDDPLRQLRRANTGQRGSLVLPICMLMPW